MATRAGCSTWVRRQSRRGALSKRPMRRCGGASASCAGVWRRIRVVRPGRQLGDIGYTIQKFAESHGFSVVREFCGHGIGAQFHEEPQVFHYGRPGTGLTLAEGMIFTMEPMINAGRAAIRSLADGWTIVTADHSLSAQWEHTVLVTNDGYEVLTVSAGAPPPPTGN